MQALLSARRAATGKSYSLIRCGCQIVANSSRHRTVTLTEHRLRQFCVDTKFQSDNNWSKALFVQGDYPLKRDFLRNRRDYRFCELDSLRHIHTSCVSWEQSSSKVEETVKSLKDKEGKDASVIPKVVEKKSIKQRVIDEVVHYYHGFRLLFIDIKISTILCWRMLKGHSLTRREHKLLIRTVGDMFRLVPFSVFIVVPFMEFLLPVFIKFFPGMLPSTFQSAKDTEEKIKQSLKVKIEMAKFLQETLDAMAVQHRDHNSLLAKEFTEWFHRVRKTGEFVSSEEIMKYSKLFEDEVTLDSLSHEQIVALCRVLDVQTFGNIGFLKFLLRTRLRHLIADDKMIQKEGIESLTLGELQQACRARGMRAYGVPDERLRRQLAQWLDLTLVKKVPHSLLLMSRALMLPEFVATEDKLKATISALPDNIVTQTKAAIGEKEGKIDNKVRLEVLKEEERKCKEERAEQLAREQAEKLARKTKEIDELIDKAPVILAEATRPLVDPAKPITYTSKDIEMLENALDSVSKEKKKLAVEKGELEELKEEMADYKEDIEEFQEVVKTDNTKELKESKAAKLLYTKVNSMIGKIEQTLDDVDRKEAELRAALIEEHQSETSEPDLAKVAEHKDKSGDWIRIDELVVAIKKLSNAPDHARMEHITQVLSKMDDDGDGYLKVEDVLKVIELVGKEDVQLSSEQVEEIVKLIDKEELLELQDKIEKTLQKDMGDVQTIKVKVVKPDNSNGNGSGMGKGPGTGGSSGTSGNPNADKKLSSATSIGADLGAGAGGAPPIPPSAIKNNQQPPVKQV